MKKINRSPALTDFTNLIHGNNKPTNWEAFSSPESQHHELYIRVRTQLLSDQLNTSGYTERPLDPDGAIHIDHFRKRSMFPQLEFDWNNFVVDEANNADYGADFKDSNIKIANYTHLINPVLDNPEQYLSYMADGTMIPLRSLTAEEDITRARETIRLFNLNHPDLVHRRAGLICAIQQLKAGNLSKQLTYDSMSAAGFTSLIDYVYAQ